MVAMSVSPNPSARPASAVPSRISLNPNPPARPVPAWVSPDLPAEPHRTVTVTNNTTRLFPILTGPTKLL